MADGSYRGVAGAAPGPGRAGRGQRAAAGRLRAGSGAERDAGQLASRGAEVARRWRHAPTRCPRHRGRRSTTTSRTPGRRSTRACRASRPESTAAVQATAPAGAHLPGQADHRLLLLHLRRADRERRELVRGLRARSPTWSACATPTTASRPATAPSCATPAARWLGGCAAAPPGRFVRVQVTKRGVSPRIVRARIVGTKGAASIDGGTAAHAARPARHLGELQQGGELERPGPDRRAGSSLGARPGWWSSGACADDGGDPAERRSRSPATSR